MNVRGFYEELGVGEWARLEGPLQRIEYLSTLRLIEKYLPNQAVICDVGCGPGRYSVELLSQGHRVTLFDLTPSLLAIARENISKQGLNAEAFVTGDARDLSAFADGDFDAALVLGPLYHVPPEDRPRVLKETNRILRRGGVAIFAYLNAWGVLRTAVTDSPERFQDPGFARSLDAEGRLGIWYWTTPAIAERELEDAGFTLETYAGAEGFAAGLNTLVERLARENPQVYAAVVQAAVDSSEAPQYRDTTAHVHFVCRKL